jgi:hypothetical protein
MARHWPDQITRSLLEHRAVNDDEFRARGTALQLLAAYWPDPATRALISQRAVQDKDSGVRITALRVLVAKWPDAAARTLLGQQAAADASEHTRVTTLQLSVEKWPDDTTRALLERHVREVKHPDTRTYAIDVLVQKWPDEATRALLAQCAIVDPDVMAPGAAWSALGKMHSGFGRILPRRYLDTRGPFLDPLLPIPRDHIEEAAKLAGIRPEEIDAHVASLSAFVGWDITRGARAPAERSTKRGWNWFKRG